MLIKYYGSATCYDGKVEFALGSSSNKRMYPDEHLIACILNGYIAYRCKGALENKTVIVLTEPWSGMGVNKKRKTINSDDGGANTAGINELILDVVMQVLQVVKQNNKHNTLILVPFLYGYHHPGIAIDVKNKIAIYIDSFGQSAQERGYRIVLNLQKILEKQNFHFKVVNTKQQQDGTSCGPILTASMIKFIEEFVESGSVTTDNFKPAQLKQNFLATDRFFQMYIKNRELNIKTSPPENVYKEIMLANEKLWENFCDEQIINKETKENIISLVKTQMLYINGLKNKKLTKLDNLKISFIHQLQSRITEEIFLKNQEQNNKNNQHQPNEKINKLVMDGYKILNTNEVDLFKNEKFIALSEAVDLLDKQYLPYTQKVLGLEVKPKVINNVNSIINNPSSLFSSETISNNNILNFSPFIPLLPKK